MTAPRRSLGWRDHAFGLALGVAYVAVLLRTVRGLGYARDEGFYVRAAESYARWFELLARDRHAAMQRSAVDAAWAVNHEHPALLKSLFALSWLAHKKLHLFVDEGTSFRFGGMIFGGLTLWLLYAWGTQARSRAAGLAAALAYATMPRVFYHAHLDCFDAPMAAMWALTAYVYWRSRSGGLGWALATGVVFGLALDTKHNAWFLPPALVLHALLARGGGLRRDLQVGRVRVPLSLVAMATVGPAVFFALWPWLWFDTGARLVGWAQFHLNHEYYNMVFLGVTYWKPPFPRAYAPFMTLATVPTVTLVLFAVGALGWAFARVRAWRAGPARGPRDLGHTELLWAIGLFVQYAPWLSSSTPIFGGTKHWMGAYPFLCLFAGLGFERALAAIESVVSARVPRPLVGGLVGASVLAAPLAETAHAHPWGLSSYTPLVGGAPGAATLGLNRQFWGFTTGAVAGWLNDHVPRSGGQVYVHDTAWDSWDVLRRDGRLAPWVQPAVSPAPSTFALYHHEPHMEGVEYQIWVAYGTASPAYVGSYDGVPIVYVYEKPPR